MSALEVAHLLPCRAQAGLPSMMGPSAPLRGSLLAVPSERKGHWKVGDQKVRAWGPWAEGGHFWKSADFVVEAIGDDVSTLGSRWLQWEVPRGQRLARPPSQGLQGPHELVAAARLLSGGPIAS